MNKQIPPVDILHKILRLDKDTGTLWWKERPHDLFLGDSKFSQSHRAARWNSRHAGKRACRIYNQGYFAVGIFWKNYMAHRIVYSLHHGHHPKMQIDHINGIRSDNRPENLRDVSNRANARNARIFKSNTSGFHGVTWNKLEQKWKARINSDSRRICLGTFSTKEEAIQARIKAEIKYGYHENHGGMV